jgi:HPt (histidine-containing phosphotransfer) domain-containing protein
LRSHCHRIKGLAGSLGYALLTQRAAPIEGHIDQQNWQQATHHAQALLQALNDCMTQPLTPLDEAFG